MRAYIGALAPLLLIGPQAIADQRAPMAGAEPILPSRFTPMGYEIVAPRIKPASGPAVQATRDPPKPRPTATRPFQEDTAAPLQWSLPLVDRTLGAAEKAADLGPELIDAIRRIVPIYDPTRLEGPDAEYGLIVSAGTAAADSVFADRWRRSSPDANINAKVAYIAMAWQMKPAACDSFSKNRRHEFDEPALTTLSAQDCARLLAQEARGFAAEPFAPIVVAPVSVPVFAAPMPGSRLSSKDFWAAQRARIAAIQAHLAQKQRWRQPTKDASLVGTR